MSDTNESKSGQQGDRPVYRGRVVWWEGVKYRVLRRRAVTGLAMLQTDTHELFLAELDGGDGPGWVGQNEVEPAAE
ncbi:MAG: hypothetical protein ABGY75_16740 [Gemmataceae bacterium]